MSNDTARFGLELLDKVSGPAERIVGGLESATGSLEKLGATSGAASGGMSKMAKATEVMTVGLRALQIAGAAIDLARAVGGVDGLRKGLLRTSQALRRFGMWAAQGLKRVAPFAAGGAGLYGLGKIASTVAVPALGATAIGIGAIGLAAGGAVVAVGYLGMKLAGLAAGGVAATAGFAVFGENARLAFTKLAKHGADGGKLLEHAKNRALELGLGVRDTITQYKDFYALQFTPREADRMVGLGADLRAFGVEAEKVAGVFMTMGQIKSKGRLQAEELMQLNERNVSADLVKKRLGKMLGVDGLKVDSLISAGKVDSKTALAAIEGALNDKLNQKEAGETGRHYANNMVEGMVGKIKARAESIGLMLGDRLLPSLHRLTRGALDWVEAFVSSGRAGELVSSIGLTFDRVGGVLVKIQPLVGRLLEGFSGRAAQAFEGLASSVGALDGTDTAALGASFEQMGKGLADIVIYGGIAVGALSALAGVVATGFHYLTSPGDLLGKVGEVWYGIGTSIVFGIGRGIRDGAYAVVDAVTGVADAAANRLRSALDIRSPSKVFGELGAATALGFAVGISSSAGLAADASHDMGLGAARAGEQAAIAQLGAAPGSMSMGGFDAGGFGRGGVQVSFGDIIVSVEGSGDANEIASTTSREVRRQIEGFFRQLGQEG